MAQQAPDFLPGFFFWCGCLLCLPLAACGSQDDDDLRAWMEQVKNEAHAVPAALPRFPAIQPVVYDPSNLTDPFDIRKIDSLKQGQSASELQPDAHRSREPLESYPLDSLRMVGSLRRQGQALAVIAADKTLYQVRKGDHLGQDQGKVVGIGDDVIDIEELVQESAGAWTRRRVQLSIQVKK